MFRSTSEGGQFVCPCHQAHFDLDGKRTESNSQSPRNMDTLDVQIRNQNEVWVKYETFIPGKAEKVVGG
jgi:Rieske Fe-S protein